MLHTFQADFYRFFRSKAVWITEFIFLLTTLSAVFSKLNAVQLIQALKRIKVKAHGEMLQP